MKRLIAIFVGLVALGGAATLRSASPAAEEALPAAGHVTILRDEWGVPHILAAREQDGFFGMGYALAEDQLDRLLIGVLHARGEFAAHLAPGDLPPGYAGFNPDPEQAVESDYEARLWRVREQAEAAVAKLDPDVRQDYAAFVAGVEAYMRAHPDKTPAWRPTGLSVADMIALPHYTLWDIYQGGVPLGDCRRGGVTPFEGSDPPPSEASTFSNEWALAPSRTSTGGAILLSDPHGGMDGRFTHEYQMEAGDLHSAGFAAGPLMTIGRNARLGWALTTGSPDTGDCYTIRTTAPGGLTYLYDGQPRQMTARTITIAVKGRAAVTRSARYATVNGILSPVVAEKGGVAYVPVTPYLDDLAGMHNSVHRMAKAQNTDAFAAAVATGGMFPQNLLAADTRGQMIYIHAGLVPIRPDPSLDWTRPVSGNDSRYAWRGIHPASDLVTIRNPASGYLENNNTDPRFMDVTRPRETVGKPDYLLADGLQIPTDHPSIRARLFLDAVAAQRTFSEADARAVALDTHSLFWDRWIALLHQAPAGGEGDSAFRTDLLGFDGRLDAASTAALKFIYWREAMRAQLSPASALSLARTIIGRQPATPELLTLVTAATHDAAQRLTARPKGLARTYGDDFRLAAGRTTLPMSGGAILPLDRSGRAPDCRAAALLCPETLLAVHYGRPGPDGTHIATQGTRILRLDFYSPTGIRSFDYQNPGIADAPASPHSSDQARALVSRQQLKPILFTRADLTGHIRSREVLPTGQ